MDFVKKKKNLLVQVIRFLNLPNVKTRFLVKADDVLWPE
jgi:hypothetical protein